MLDYAGFTVIYITYHSEKITLRLFTKVVAMGLAIVATNFAVAKTTTNGTFTAEQNAEISQQVKTYIDNNPKVVVDALVSYRQQEMQKMQEQAKNAISENASKILTGPNMLVLGNSSGTTILVEFLDFQCGKMSETVDALIAQNKNLKVIVKELPILGENSNFAARIAMSANKQGKFAEVHKAFVSNNEPLTAERATTLAKEQGVDWSLIEKEMASAEVEKQLDSVFSIAQQLNIMGTPAFIITDSTGKNNKFFGGAVTQEAMQKTIDSIS